MNVSELLESLYQWFAVIGVIGVVLIVLVNISYMARRFALKRLTYARHFVQTGVFEGDTVELVEEICNNSFVPLLWVDVESFLPAELALFGYERGSRPMQRFISRFTLAPYTKIRRTIKIECVRRGFYKLETVNARFLYTKIFITSKTQLYVYPKPLEQVENSPLQSDAQSLLLSERQLIQDPFSFSGIRDYRHGDSFRAINFKATAKNMALMVNTREFISVRNFMIYVDFRIKTGDAEPDAYNILMERALSWSSDLIQKAIQSGGAAGFAANCRNHLGARYTSYPMGSGYSHYSEILAEMAKIRVMAGNSMASVIANDLNTLRNAEIFIYTTDIAQDFGVCLDVLRAAGNVVSLIEMG